MLKGRFLPVMILALTMSAQAAYAGDDTKAAGDAPKEKKVCKSERMTGSLTRVNRVCMTQAEWDKLAERTSKSVDDLNRNQNRAMQTQVGQGPVNPGVGF